MDAKECPLCGTRMRLHTREQTDRVPPAELLELALDETAYLFETRGPRARQARENLKKIRAMRVPHNGHSLASIG